MDAKEAVADNVAEESADKTDQGETDGSTFSRPPVKIEASRFSRPKESQADSYDTFCFELFKKKRV